ncbi:MAG: extracellular solute-binding protein [Lachnospiraceae bacterium]|nr:extracellular solute-binding protein [Clostridiales bacterium]MDY3110263.1 extracellular solute-binding protein [Lachnospiraceae bacterium]
MKGNGKKIGIGIAIVAVIVVAVLLVFSNKVEDFHDKYEGVDLYADVAGMERQGAYTGYLNEHAGAACPAGDIEIDLFSCTGEGMEKMSSYEGESNVLMTEVGSSVSWSVDVPEAGFYNLYMEYLLPESRGVAAERELLINGEVPFEDARNISFTRIWKDGGNVRVDNQGNEIRPTQVEYYDWQYAFFRDDMGYITEPYRFYLEKGTNEITINGENEPIALKKLVVTGIKDRDTYAEYIAKQPQVNASDTAKKYEQVIQGETSTLRSESSLYAKYDRSSPSTQPNSVTHTVLNYVGGDAWRSSGQWIEWEFEVPEDGYYNIMVKGRQNYSRGGVSSRTIYIDDQIPFKEMEEISFEYANDWECKQLGDEEGTPYQFYLTAGKHTIRLEATLGGVGAILEELEDSTYRLNQIYRKVLVYTGANPDKYRDYNIHIVYPEIMEAMDLESKRLFKIVDDMVAYSGQKAANIASAQTVAQQLERFVEKPNKITLEFTTFKDNITALGTAALNMSETKLDIDYITVSGVDVKVKKDKAGPIAKLGHELKSFAASFVVDYDAVGDVYEDDGDVVKVWILTGRDQGTILKAMVDDTFTPNTGVKVNVEIVAPDALLNAVVAGRGPNVVLSVGADQPVNYALRNAAEDLTQFPDYKEVLSAFTPSSYEQYRLDEHIYGMPETQTFNVMFYRKDVLEELELEVPNTWQELIEMLPTIQGNNLSVGIPTAAGSSSTAAATTAVASNVPDLSLYFTLLFQYGGDMYNEAGTKTTVDDEAGVKAFDDYVKYFNDYGLPTIYDFVSRFRSGEMPIGIAAYSTYNTLMVSAPEIRGLWDFTVIPGTERTAPDGTKYIDRSDFITGSATMMIKTEDDKIRNDSWEFMKWWASKDTQVRFGREIEALLGSSARYATANKEAFSQLAWSADDIAVLSEQWDATRGIREVPGGYYTGRHISNAIRKVINDKDDSRETIIDYSIKIDEEIVKKRKEFGLPVEE